MDILVKPHFSDQHGFYYGGQDGKSIHHLFLACGSKQISKQSYCIKWRMISMFKKICCVFIGALVA